MDTDDVEILPNAALDAARAAREEKLAQFEARRVARSLIVPTDDAEVRQNLRARGQPVCYFGEDAHDRRERLRAAMAREAMENGARAPTPEKMEVEAVKMEEEVTAPEEKEEEYYTEGEPALKELRLALAKPSLERAMRRLQAERSVSEIKDVNHPMRQREREAEAKIVESVRGSYMISSQVGDRRPLSAISYGVHPSGKGAIIATGSWGGTVKVWQGGDACSNLQTIDIHSARISTVHLPREYPDVLLTSSADCTASIHCLSTKEDVLFECRHRFSGHKARVSDAKIHPFHKSLVATCSFDGTVFLYDDGKTLLRQETGHKQVYRVCFHPDGGLMGTCGLDGGMRLWDQRSGRAVMTMTKAHADDVLGMECSGDGRVLASCGKDNLVRIWDLRTQRCVKTIAAHQSLISGLRFGGGVGDSDVLFTCSFDRTIKCWSSRRNWGLLAAHTSHEDKVTAIDCAADGSRVVSACYDKTWKLWGQDT